MEYSDPTWTFSKSVSTYSCMTCFHETTFLLHKYCNLNLHFSLHYSFQNAFQNYPSIIFVSLYFYFIFIFHHWMFGPNTEDLVLFNLYEYLYLNQPRGRKRQILNNSGCSEHAKQDCRDPTMQTILSANSHSFHF